MQMIAQDRNNEKLMYCIESKILQISPSLMHLETLSKLGLSFLSNTKAEKKPSTRLKTIKPQGVITEICTEII